ncbi:exporter of polyketide antibiotics [Nonomuraea rosea]|uniref:Exporter of polyketide antibiotics n=1 Tax=Nonomuraea rosea TaxID=638574 RepID=A0ABP6X3H7_9ACTN
MNALTGTGVLVRLAVRRDRIVLPAWIAVFVLMAVGSAAATIPLYPSLASRVQAAETINGAQSMVALYGRIYDPASIGALALVKMSGFGAALVAVLAIFTVVRHTRAEEASGRQELLGAATVGRSAPLTAALLLAFGASLVLAVVTGLGLIAAGLPADGSFAFGLALGGIGAAFAAVAALVAQLTASARTAIRTAVAVLGAVYVLRAIGDTAGQTGPQWLTWLSPIGWSQQLRPFAGNRWWVASIMIAFSVVVTAGAYVLAARRDTGAGLIPDRPGRAAAVPGLSGPLALAWRLHRGLLSGWLIGFVLLGLVFGNLASSVGSFFDSPQARDMIIALGGEKGLIDAFVTAELALVATMASVYGIQAVMRMRAEETHLLAEPILATPTSRTRWAGSHLVIAILGSTLLMAVMGTAAGLAHGAQTGDMAQVGRLLGAALAHMPAIWVLIGITVAAFGLLPRLIAAGWVALTGFFLIGELGPLFQLKEWVIDLSPFAHVPRLPGGAFEPMPLALLAGLAALLAIAGLAGFRRRDIS